MTYLTNASVSLHCTKAKWIIAILLTRLVYPANIPTRLQLPDVWLVIFTAFPRLLYLVCWCETFYARLLSGWQVSATRGSTPACLDLISKHVCDCFGCGDNSGKRTGPMFVQVHFSPQCGKYTQLTDVCKDPSCWNAAKQTPCSLQVQVLLVKLKTLHTEGVFFRPSSARRLLPHYFCFNIPPKIKTAWVLIWRTGRPNPLLLLSPKNSTCN